MRRSTRFFNSFNFASGNGLLFLAAWFPIWRSWSVSSWCGCGERSTLWSATENMARGNPYIEYWSWIFVWHRENWVQAPVIFAVGYVGGWLIRKWLAWVWTGTPPPLASNFAEYTQCAPSQGETPSPTTFQGNSCSDVTARKMDHVRHV